jgi:hypothetical protein
MQIRRQTKRTTSYLATMTMLGFISSTSRRTIVRAAFTAGDFGSKTAFGRVGPHAYTNSRPIINQATSRTQFVLYDREPTNRAMSTAAADQELDSALDELLGEALKEAETPAAEGGKGHIEGSHPFPKDLVEQVCVCIFIASTRCLH